MPAVVTFDDNRSRGHSRCFGFHVLLPLRVGTAGLDLLLPIPISRPMKPSDVGGVATLVAPAAINSLHDGLSRFP
jgi:hypothetical protein